MTRLAWSPVDGARFATKAWGVVPRSRARTQWSGLAAGATAFDPLSLSPAAWYKADAGTSTTTDGVAISQWNDQSGNARHLTQATGANQPLYKAAIQNGLAVVRFDGTNDVMATASFAHTQQFSVFAVFKSSAGVQPQGAVCVDPAVNPRMFQHRYNTGLLEAIAFDTTPNAFTDTEAATVSQFNTTATVRGAATVQTWVNGTSGGSTATSGTSNSGSAALTAGAASMFTGSATQLLNGDIGEILYYPTALSTTDRASVEVYLKSRWGTP